MSSKGRRMIGMWLDSYDDVFSDFDPRPYAQRAISDDFLNEAKKMFIENPSGVFELKMLIPKKLRREVDDQVVAKRLKQYFRNVRDVEIKGIRRQIRNGVLFSLMGFLFLFSAVMVMRIDDSSLMAQTLLVILEPAGWFTIWSGLDKLILEIPSEKKELDFFIKMADGEINFESY